jgi:hypothetical protein
MEYKLELLSHKTPMIQQNSEISKEATFQNVSESILLFYF